MSNRIFNFGKKYTVPLAKEEDDLKNDIITWGKDNLYPQWINTLFYQCAVHQGIIKGKVFYTISSGLKKTPNNAELLKLVNPILHAIDLNLELSDTFYVKCRLSTDLKKIESVKHIPYEWVRVTKNGNFKVSQDWTDNTVEIVEYRSYKNRIDNELIFVYQFKVEPMQMLVEIDKKNVTYNYYPNVPYSGAIKSILSDIEITNYTLSEVVNNFSLGTILSLNNGYPKTEDDREDIEDRILEAATGSDNAGGVFITFGDGEDTKPTVVHLNGNQLHERYLSLSEDIRQNMLRGHSVSNGELFGFEKDGSFNADTLDFSYWMFYENYVRVRQRQLLEFINYVAKFNGINEPQEFNKVELPYKKNEPTTQLSAQFNEQDATNRILSKFREVGCDRSEIDIIAKETYNDDKPFADVFTTPLNETKLQVLNLISQGESFDAIARALNIDTVELSALFGQLRNDEYLDQDSNITKSGKLAIVQSGLKKMSIMYTYEVKPGYGPEIIKGSRTFCKDMIQMNKAYTREEIDNISSIMNMDVWRYRGGWYHNPNTDKNEPSCRHQWTQNLIFE